MSSSHIILIRGHTHHITQRAHYTVCVSCLLFRQRAFRHAMTHHRIINNMKDIANKNNLKIITTEKDFLRLTKKQQKSINYLKVKLKIQNISKLKKFLTSNI